MAGSKYPIIAHGELYVEPIAKKSGGGQKDSPHEYEEAKPKIIADLNRIFDAIHEKQEIFLKEKIVCVRMEPKFEAKSYVPNQLLTTNNMSIVGGRKYRFRHPEDDSVNPKELQVAKLYFVKTDDMGLSNLRETLTSGVKDNVKNWCDQIGSIHSLDLLRADEKIMGFPEDWNEGTVEIVLHPLENEQGQMLDSFYSTSKIPRKDTRVKAYKSGLTFISAKCSRVELENIKCFNPLRAIHPLGQIDITPVRAVSVGNAPQPSSSNKKSRIVVGVFDGGTDDTLPLLKGYVKTTDCVSTAPNDNYLSHGIAVCGAVLHGNLVGKSNFYPLPTPYVSVESYRVLPIQDKTDFELYEAIDEIEKIVTIRRDLKLCNVSFGPKGAIIDDSINRFTYVLDQLTYDVPEGEVNPLFCVAAGNDGDLPEPFNRVQSPADMVNGLGVGAYTLTTVGGSKIRASYSCVGNGREGAKVKPDLLDFGGSIDRPFVLVGSTADSLATSFGTSFASPYTVHKIGKLMAKSENIEPHLGRTLLIHTARFNKKFTRDEQGHGFCLEDVDEILSCDDKKVTILYSGLLKPAQIVNLPIFAPNINSIKGMVNISWTITTIVAPYANDPDAYTNDCIKDVFIPHDEVFKYSKENTKTRKPLTKILNLCKEVDVEKAKVLLAEGYTKSMFPASHSTKSFRSEDDLRVKDFKWDTVIKKHQRMRSSSLRNPCLTLQAIDRNEFNAQSIKYHVAVSIEAQSYTGSLYDAILQTYKNLAPITLRNINRIMVDINS
jgi:hypothetical protein